MNYNREKYHELLAQLAENCVLRLETLQLHTKIMLAHEKLLSDDSDQCIASIEAALVKVNRAMRSVSEAIDHIQKAKEE